MKNKKKINLKDLIPAIRICARCPNISNDFIEVECDDGGVDAIHSWYCQLEFELELCGMLFYDDAKNIRDNSGVIPLAMKSLPLECPYTVEHLFSQGEAGRERLDDLLPLLKMRI